MYILGLSFTGRDPSACILKDGEIIAMIEEERLLRRKHADNSFPELSIKFCLKVAGIDMADVGYITFGWDAEKFSSGFMTNFYDEVHKKYKVDERTLKWEKDNLTFFNKESLTSYIQENLRHAGFWGRIPEIFFMPHHYSHAAQSFLQSGFSESLTITIDGSGDENCTVIWCTDADKIEKLEEINIPHSLGWFYAAITEYLGFEAYDGEYKVMGLAPYGKPNKFIFDQLKNFIDLDNCEYYSLNPYYSYYGQHTYSSRFTDHLADSLGQPPRQKFTPVSNFHKDVACAAQDMLEKAMLKLIKKAIDKYSIRNICLSGGVAMNCKMNGRLLKMPEVERLFVHPLCSDLGLSLGSALALHFNRKIDRKPNVLEHLYYGPEFSNEEIKEKLDRFKLPYRYCEDIEIQTAKLLAGNKIGGWFQGRMEVGARALGARSIIANPADEKSKDRVNGLIKSREGWRPFCPSILEEYFSEYIQFKGRAPFMIITFSFKEDVKNRIPAVVHVDGTARPQTVSKSQNKRFWNLIDEFRKLTGIPLLLNTSFNVREEPIVCDIKDALRTYYSTGLDFLVLGNFLLRKDSKL